MGETTGISWCDHTFNPWIGCVKVSPGCEHCYAETLAKNRMGLDVWGPAKTTQRKPTSASYWLQPHKWNRAAEQSGSRRRVFCGSMCDWAENHPALNPLRNKLFTLIQETPWLDWLLLTKRVDRLEHILPTDFAGNYPNVWLGTSCENQDLFDTRWPVLEWIGRRYYVAQLFLSLEPLLGPIDISGAYWFSDEEHSIRSVNWVIVGGESGAGHRPMDLDWARSIRDQCVSEEIPFFYKQGGGLRPGQDAELDGQVWHQFPEQPADW